MAAARDATHVVLVVGLQSHRPCYTTKAYHRGGNEFNPCGFEGEQHDRGRLDLPTVQKDLAAQVLAAPTAAREPPGCRLRRGRRRRAPPSAACAASASAACGPACDSGG